MRCRNRLGFSIVTMFASFVAICSPSIAQTTEGSWGSAVTIARSVSLMAALSTECSKQLEIDLDKAQKYQQVFLDTGAKFFGADKFRIVLLEEMKRRNDEVKTTGRSQWCTNQQVHNKKVVDGFKKFQGGH
jgi:hypothetical protein